MIKLITPEASTWKSRPVLRYGVTNLVELLTAIAPLLEQKRIKHISNRLLVYTYIVLYSTMLTVM